jgi:hypothetical protein
VTLLPLGNPPFAQEPHRLTRGPVAAEPTNEIQWPIPGRRSAHKVSLEERYNPRHPPTGPQSERRHGYRQFEPTRSRAARVQKQNATASFDDGLVRMTAQYRGYAACCKIEIEFGKIVKHVNELRLNPDQVTLGKAVGPASMVIVATDRPDRRDSSERLQNRRIADVATMNDQV